MKKYTWIISAFICLLLCALFGYLYFDNHAFGAWGDDSAGYIYLWGRLDQNKSLVYQEPLTVKALDFFQDEKLARWTTPTHHEIISPSGYLASKYPIGLSLLLFLFSSIFRSDIAIYYAVPTLAVFIIILVYLIGNFIFKNIKYKFLLSATAALIVGLSTLFYEAAVSQPMREIPSIFFILFGYYCLLRAIESRRYGVHEGFGVLFYILIILSFLSFGFSINIRETSLIILPVFLLLFFQLSENKKENIKTIIKLSLFSMVILVVGLLPTIINSVKISQYKEKFKKKDVTSIAITSNFDHIRSFNFSNILNNNGKFKSGEQGGLGHYWRIMKEFSAVPYFLLLVLIGFIFLYQKNKWLFLSLAWWVISVILIFSLWINPYSRYILPIFPILAIMAAYGLYNLFVQMIPMLFQQKKWQYLVCFLVVFSLIISYQPVVASILANLKLPKEETLVYKSISNDDLLILKEINNKIKTTMSPSLPTRADNASVLIFTGAWQYGISETLEAHTGLPAMRMPLEQKFKFNDEKVKEFFNKNILSDYLAYIWLDTTTKPETRDWLEKNYNLKEIYKNNFSFEEEATIYELTPKN